MKVLILSMTVGQGHNSTSKAMSEALTQSGHECEILDSYKFLNKVIGAAFDKGYTAMGRFLPKLNENIYSFAEKHSGSTMMKADFPWAFADWTKTKMQKYIQQFQPDVIICSIVMTAIVITSLKEAGMISDSIKTVGIVTDFSLHPYWEYTAMDYFVVPSELLIPSLKKRGIAEHKILPTGIPISPKFSTSVSKEEAREMLGLEQDKFTVMVASGGMGFSGLIPVLTDLDTLSDIQIVATCGTNARLKSRLDSMQFKNKTHFLSFVTNMHEYLDAADILITKPGGLSTSEAIAKGKPLILTRPMPGVENMNLPFLVNNSMAMFANQYAPLSDVVEQFMMNTEKQAEMHCAQQKWGKKNSAEALAAFIEKLI